MKRVASFLYDLASLIAYLAICVIAIVAPFVIAYLIVYIVSLAWHTGAA